MGWALTHTHMRASSSALTRIYRRAPGSHTCDHTHTHAQTGTSPASHSHVQTETMKATAGSAQLQPEVPRAQPEEQTLMKVRNDAFI